VPPRRPSGDWSRRLGFSPSGISPRRTNRGLLQADYRCWLAADAVGSRRLEDRKAAVERLL